MLPTTVAVNPAVPGQTPRVRRWFYISAALFVLLVSVFGFGPSLIDESARNAPVTPVVMAHGIVAAAWLFLFLTQAILAATGRITLHRRLGRVGPVLAILLIGLGFFMLIDGAERGGSDLSGDLSRALTIPGSPPLSAEDAAVGILFPLSGFLNFGVLVAAGLWYRQRPDIHKRLMLLALTPLVGEPIIHLVGHLAIHWPTLEGAAAVKLLPIQVLLPFAVAINDKVSQGRIHPVSLWIPILLIVEAALMPVVAFTPAGREFATWLVRLGSR